MLSEASDFLRLHTPGHQIAFEEVVLDDDDDPSFGAGGKVLRKLPSNRPNTQPFDQDFDPRRKEHNAATFHSASKPAPENVTPTRGQQKESPNTLSSGGSSNRAVKSSLKHGESPLGHASYDKTHDNHDESTREEPEQERFVRFRPYQKAIPRNHLLFLHSCSYLMTHPWTLILSIFLVQVWSGSLFPVIVIEGLSKTVSHILLDHSTYLLRRMIIINAIAIGILVTSICNSIGVLLIWELLKTDSHSLKLVLTVCIAIIRCLGHGWGLLQLKSVRTLEDQLPVAEQIGLMELQGSLDDWTPVVIPLSLGLSSLAGDSIFLTGVLLVGLLLGLVQLYFIHGAYDDLFVWLSDEVSGSQFDTMKQSDEGDDSISREVPSETWLEFGYESGFGIKDTIGLVRGYWGLDTRPSDSESVVEEQRGTGDRQYVVLVFLGFFLMTSFVESRQAIMVARLCSEGINGATVGLLASIGTGCRLAGARAYQGMIVSGSADRRFATTAFLLGTLVFQLSVATAHLINPGDDLLLLLGLIPLGFSLGGTCSSIHAYLSLVYPRVHARCFMRIHAFYSRVALISSFVLPLLFLSVASFSVALFVALFLQTCAAAFYLHWMSWAPHACTA